MGYEAECEPVGSFGESRPTGQSARRVVWNPWIRIEFLVSMTVVVLCAAGLFFLIVAYNRQSGLQRRADDADVGIQSVNAIKERQEHIINAINVIREQNEKSIADREQIHQYVNKIDEKVKKIAVGKGGRE
jgi:hypothetical protein